VLLGERIDVRVRELQEQAAADQVALAEHAGREILDHERVREAVDDTLSIEIQGAQAHIKGNDSHFKIFTQNPSDFPPIPDFEGAADFEIPGGLLKGLIAQTLFAAAKESTRYAFNGVLLTTKGKKINLVATDGRRLGAR
jgi:DNA polymerase-3 subunit beta